MYPFKKHPILVKYFLALITDPKDERLDQVFRPLVFMAHDVQDTFKSYPEIKRDVLLDFAQPLRGVGQVLRGSVHLIAIPLLFLGYTIKYIATSDSLSDFSGDMKLNLIHSTGLFFYGLTGFIRGATQIITTPLTWFLRIPLRSIITGIRELGAEESENWNDFLDVLQPEVISKNGLTKGELTRTLQNTFKPYISRNGVLIDFAQPLRGIGDVLFGLTGILIVPGSMIYRLFTLSPDYREDFFMLFYSLLSLVVGVIQIITTPLTWFLRIPLRSIITSMTDPLKKMVIGTEREEKIPTTNIVTFLEKHPKITSLELKHDETKVYGAEVLHADTLSINIGNNWIGNSGAYDLVKNTTLASLNMSDNRSRGPAANRQALAQALASNRTLTSLDISGNWFWDNPARAVAQALASNTTLTSLNISRNEIGYVGTEAFANVLTTNTTLTSLDISTNGIQDTSAQDLAKALENNHTITSCRVTGNNIREKTLERIDNIIRRNKSAPWQQAAFLISVDRAGRKMGFSAGSGDSLWEYELCDLLRPNFKSKLNPAHFAKSQFFKNSTQGEYASEHKEENTLI